MPATPTKVPAVFVSLSCPTIGISGAKYYWDFDRTTNPPRAGPSSFTEGLSDHPDLNELRTMHDMRNNTRKLCNTAGIPLSAYEPANLVSMFVEPLRSPGYNAYLKSELTKPQIEDETETTSPVDQFTASGPHRYIGSLQDDNCRLNTEGTHPIVTPIEGILLLEQTENLPLGTNQVHDRYILPARFSSILRGVVRRCRTFVASQGYVSHPTDQGVDRPGVFSNISYDTPPREWSPKSRNVSGGQDLTYGIAGIKSSRGEPVAVFLIVLGDHLYDRSLCFATTSLLNLVVGYFADTESHHGKREEARTVLPHIHTHGLAPKFCVDLVKHAPIVLQAYLCMITGGQIAPKTIGEKAFILAIPAEEEVVFSVCKVVPALRMSSGAGAEIRNLVTSMLEPVGREYIGPYARVIQSVTGTPYGVNSMLRIQERYEAHNSKSTDSLVARFQITAFTVPSYRCVDIIAGLRATPLLLHNPRSLLLSTTADDQASELSITASWLVDQSASFGRYPTRFGSPAISVEALLDHMSDENNYDSNGWAQLTGFFHPIGLLWSSHQGDSRSHRQFLTTLRCDFSEAASPSTTDTRQTYVSTLSLQYPEVTLPPRCTPDVLVFLLLANDLVPELCVRSSKKSAGRILKVKPTTRKRPLMDQDQSQGDSESKQVCMDTFDDLDLVECTSQPGETIAKVNE